MAEGIGRQKELQLDELIRRWLYVHRRLMEEGLSDPEGRDAVAALLVLADATLEVVRK